MLGEMPPGESGNIAIEGEMVKTKIEQGDPLLENVATTA